MNHQTERKRIPPGGLFDLTEKTPETEEQNVGGLEIVLYKPSAVGKTEEIVKALEEAIGAAQGGEAAESAAHGGEGSPEADAEEIWKCEGCGASLSLANLRTTADEVDLCPECLEALLVDEEALDVEPLSEAPEPLPPCADDCENTGTREERGCARCINAMSLEELEERFGGEREEIYDDPANWPEAEEKAPNLPPCGDDCGTPGTFQERGCGDCDMRESAEVGVEERDSASVAAEIDAAIERIKPGFGALGIVEPPRAPVDLAEVERRDRLNTLALLEAKARQGKPLKPGEKKELRRLQAMSDGRRLVGSLDELAAALAVSLRTVKNWAAEDGFPVEPEEMYDVEAVAGWRAARGNGNGHKPRGAASAAAEADEDEDGKDWEAVKDEYAAKRERLKYEKERGKLIDRATVEREWAARVAAVAAGLLALPRVVASLLQDGMSPEEREAVIDKQVRALLENYARPLPDEWGTGGAENGE